MHNKIVVAIENTAEYAALVAALTKEGIAFHGGCNADGWWLEITGH